jgi:hypothetical protein
MHVRQDCIMAETYLRLDHLETAIQNSQHGEMISGLMMRMDHLHEDIANMGDSSHDQIMEVEAKRKFKSEVSPRIHSQPVQALIAVFAAAFAGAP